MSASLSLYARAMAARSTVAHHQPFLAARALQSRLLSNSARRNFSVHHVKLAGATPAYPPSSGLAKLPHRALISIAGEDATRLLQGLVTNSMQSLSEKSGMYAAFLNAQGRILTDCFVYRVSSPPPINHDSYLIEIDRSVTTNMLQYLKTHKLRSKVTLAKLPAGEFEVWTAWDAEIEARASDGNWSKNVLHLDDPRLGKFAHRMLVPARMFSEENSLRHIVPDALSVLPVLSSNAYRLRRYVFGIAEGVPDILPNKSLPHEYNMDLLNGIDFQKGCYVGQELTIRTQHTGVVRKRILPVQIYPVSNTDTPSNLQAISSEEASAVLGLDADVIPRDIKIRPAGRPRTAAGKWVAGLGNVGLASCRLEMMTDIRISPDADQAAAADVGKDSVFGLAEWEEGAGREEMRIKAFVPNWLRSRLDKI